MRMYCPVCGRTTLHIEAGRACDEKGGCSKAWDGLPCPHPEVYACAKCVERQSPYPECSRCGREIERGRGLCSLCEGKDE